ncbi:MAG: valine--tRNA ligase [Bacteroidia bacterium]|nr:valine--tRNA ligase [Bacteroidia bacterium]
MESRYAPQGIEARWRKAWEENRFYHSQPSARPAYTIVMPPPNVTGVLHMGHVLNNTLQDIIARFYRLKGYNVCWVPGTDHASIATEAKVVARLRSRGVDKRSIGRETFLEEAWKWTHEHGGIIVEQLKTLGVSADWDRFRFTLDPPLYRAVIESFVRLYRDGLIYRGKRMIHWDPVALTALSDEEVIYKEHESTMCYVRYPADNGEYLTIATVRPETILADVAVAVHPKDERYQRWIGRQVRVPLTDRMVPVIADERVDPTFGTGCLKVTPAHDPKDYEIGEQHKLPVIDIFTPEARLNEKAGKYSGLSREEARQRIIRDLEEEGLLEKTEPYKHSVGHSERTDAVVEPRLSEQWFVKMKPLAELALRAVDSGDIRLVPERFMATYRHWLENVKDWCISRQLWWGHRIPAWYAPDGHIFVASTEEEAHRAAKDAGYDPYSLYQDEDVLDTWFSSWLWPLSVFDFFDKPNNPDFRYYYPTQVLVTAPEILFFWVARMIMAGYYFAGEKPFSTVYLHGIVRDKQRRKMSKSLGNSPDPLDLIQRYGADAVRLGIVMSAPAGNDLLFDEALCEQGKNFCNKLWNSFRLLHSWREKAPDLPPSPFHLEAYQWFDNILALLQAEVEHLIQSYRFYEAAHLLYRVVWEQFCSWYLEALKPVPARSLLEKVELQVERLLQLLHPLMPYITEELWHQLKDAPETATISLSILPTATDLREGIDWHLLDAVQLAQTAISQIRRLRQAFGLSDIRQIISFTYQGAFYPTLEMWMEHFLGTKVEKLLIPSSERLFRVTVRSTGAQSYLFERTVLYQEVFLLDANLSPEKWEEMIYTLRKEKSHATNFREKLQAKLLNPNFIQKAPAEIVEKERKKLEDTEERLRLLREQLEALGAES